MTRCRAAHLVVGPDEHGVVLHGVQIAQACGHRVLRVRPGEPWPDLGGVGGPGGVDVVHVPFTDRLFAPDLDAAASRFAELREHVAASGAVLSVTLHDLPHDDSPLQLRRAQLYREVAAAARGVVVSSLLELSIVEPWCGAVHSVRLARLPVDGPVASAGPPTVTSASDAPTVAVLGFVYPDRGYEDVTAALPPHARLIALGRASDGHEDLALRYAAEAGGRWSVTGYLPDDELAERLRTADVAVAPNRRITASASVNTWIAHGRRPLVPDSPYGRELVADRPDAVMLYDPDDPDGLRRAIAAALDDPDSTRLPEGVYRGPSVDDVAAIYREHLSDCAPDVPVAVPAGWAAAGWVLPGNRWDLLAGMTPGAVSVSVVVPYYDAQDRLDRTLAALARQTLPPGRIGRFEVVVADDGSPQAPDVSAAGDIAVRVVRQDDRGFRAAAARNLGAAAASGDVLVFLDADTVPEPDFVARLARLPALCPDAVTVGRRRHADFGDDPPRLLPEPGWLRDAYAASSDLLDADSRSYRFVISAVLGMSRRLFAELGGFDERFVGYGGEDWELAHRAWVAGAVFAHVPDAVAWHDGPDWAARPEASRPGAKDAETFALSVLLPDPEERGGGQWLPYPAVVVRVGSVAAADLLAVARSAFATGADVGLWADEVTGAHAELVLADARLHLGPPPADVLARAGCVVDIGVVGSSAPDVDLATLPEVCAAALRHGEVVTPALRAYSTHARNRALRWWPGDAEAQAARLFGRHDRSTPVPRAGEDLAADLGALRGC